MRMKMADVVMQSLLRGTAVAISGIDWREAGTSAVNLHRLALVHVSVVARVNNFLAKASIPPHTFEYSAKCAALLLSQRFLPWF